MTTRNAFLASVRQAVIEGNRAGVAPPLPSRGNIAYQGGGADPIACFAQELAKAGGTAHVSSNEAHALRIIEEIVTAKTARKLVVAPGGIVAQLGLAERLRRQGLQVSETGFPAAAGLRDTLFEADLGISNVAHLVAETGSVVMLSEAQEPRSLSLLPPVHIALAHRSQLVPDLFDLFNLLAPSDSNSTRLPSCLTLITGPSKTGDIELRLVTGVHGPGEIHVVLCTW